MNDIELLVPSVDRASGDIYLTIASSTKRGHRASPLSVPDEDPAMADPDIAAKEPARIELEAGTYFWCACGRSAKQPFCDGSHQGTEFAPLRFEVLDKETIYLCQCKRTGTPPHCDGTHTKL